MKTLPIGEARVKLNAIVRDREPTIISVGNFDRAVVLPLPPDAVDTPYEAVVDPDLAEVERALEGALWLMRPKGQNDES